ncbi:hypothetical protein M2137_002019 [Parabacteroides sp. PFB2-10]|uniref:DUF5056 domain-containing protein n=1 Tax=Parabacteroides sp. PFB2-10 TaxID=1742405 RepID=UPI0024731602|nr:DUF5056 domain-containing protein [Parabacteroides sp. PFB2-10]MDH6313229.1 hypothetical protein [Parabacteroides sp. PFB2-10]
MENRSDKIIKDFFAVNKEDIPDNGFTERLREHLPVRRKSYNWIVPLFSLIGVILSFFLCLYNDLFTRIGKHIVDHPIDFFVPLLLFPIICLFVIQMVVKKEDEFI